jgi:hypothetical protein
MTRYQKQSLFFAVLATACLAGVGFSIAEHNGWLALILFVASILIVGFGFMLKAKHRKNGTL